MSDFEYILGFKEEEVSFLPILEDSDGIQKDARKSFNALEKQALIDESGAATNRSKIDVAGTHYENSSAAEIAQMIMPLKGL